MKCVSLWQPWASAIALGLKKIETRSWSTGYRGPIAIHAAKRACRLNELDIEMALALKGAGIDRMDSLPLGAIVATARLVDCCRFTNLGMVSGGVNKNYAMPGIVERAFGDFSPGRFGWMLADVQKLHTPIPLRGLQGLFDLPEGIVLQLPGGAP